MNREYHRTATRNYLRRKRVAAIELLGKICVKCGITDIRVLQIDHINGGGTKELKKGSGATYLNKVIISVLNKENKYQLLCANCNWIKRHENKENTGRPILINI